jgi:hypothetical protein
VKAFKAAKRSMGIRSRRVGFGPGAVWFWTLPISPSVAVTTATSEPSDVDEVDPSDRAPETSVCYAESMCGRPHSVLLEWARAVEILQLRPRPSPIPGHRWQIFIQDCRRFVISSWAERAAGLSWTTDDLLSSRYPNALEHLGSAGLVWNLAGGQIIQIHRDGADLLAPNGRAHRFHRRPEGTMTFRPWQ